MKPQAVPCSYCGAVVGASCMTPYGRRAHYSHESPKRAVRSTWNDAMSDSPTPTGLSESADLEARDD